MNNELQKHKTSDTVKWVLTLLAFILVGVMLAGIICGWFDKKEQPPEQPVTEETAGGSGLLVTPESTNKIRLTAMPLSADGGAEVLSDGSYTLTATIMPANAENQAVDWSVNWVNSSSDWANGKSTAEYVSVIPASEGALTATVSCKRAFGEQIKVTVTSRTDNRYSADCLCDYSKKVTGFSITDYAGYNANGFTVSSSLNSYTFDKPSYIFNYTSTTGVITYSDYTVDDNFSNSFNTTITDEYSKYLSEAGLTIQNTSKSSNHFWGGTNFFYFYASVPGGMREVSFCGLTTEQANTAVSIAKQHTDTAVYNWTITCKGTYSTYTHTIPIYFSESSLTAVVTGISLDSSTLMY